MKKKPFTPKTIEEVRIAAAFKCCICRKNPCFHTHHIDTNASNDFENAAPLCPHCHDNWGHDPSKRKFIRQARDDWYVIVKKMYSDREEELNLNREILDELEKLESKSISKNDFVREVTTVIVGTFNKIEEHLKERLEKGDYEGLAQKLSSLGSSATYSSGQIYSIDGTDEDTKNENLFSTTYPAGSRWPIICPHCFTSYSDQRINVGSVCPHCGNII